MSSPWGRGEEVEDAEDGMYESELAQLQLRLRLTNNSYHAYREETKRKIAKQMMLVNRLELDNKEFQTNLSKLETAHNKDKDEKNIAKLSRLSNVEKDHQRLIKEERAMIKKIAAETAEMEGKIAEQRKNMGGIHNTTSKHIALSKCTTSLENNLYEAVTLFNKQLAINCSLRSDIDHLRQERTVFDNLYKKLAQELASSKRDMANVIRDSTEAFEQRDEARNKTMALLERSEKDKHQHDIEIRDLQRLIHHDNRIREFMAIKASDRAELKAEEAAKKQSMDSEKNANADHVTITQYEEALEQIYEVTGQSDLTSIVENFEKNEEENFAVFNYVNELNCAIEMLHEQVASIKADIGKFEEENQSLDASRQTLMLALEEKYDGVRHESDVSANKLRHVHKAMEELLSRVNELFTKISCDPKPILEMLGGDSGITQKNAMIYLGQIEQRTTELLTSMTFIRNKKAELEGGPPSKPMGTGIGGAPKLAQVNISTPYSEEESRQAVVEDEQEEVRPLTQEELRQQVMRNLTSRLHGNATPSPAKTMGSKEKKKPN